jgi:hypothetical protein
VLRELYGGGLLVLAGELAHGEVSQQAHTLPSPLAARQGRSPTNAGWAVHGHQNERGACRYCRSQYRCIPTPPPNNDTITHSFSTATTAPKMVQERQEHTHPSNSVAPPPRGF